MTAVISAADVSKRYGETCALDGVTLEVGSGEVFALVGPNGAGKTTLVRTLTGTERPDEGSITVLGTAPLEIDSARIGLLPQSFAPPQRLTPRELMVYYAGLYDDPRSVETVLADVGMVDSADTWYANLSGGQKRRVCVGIALINDPEILFLDEPTTGIDPVGRRDVWSLLHGLTAGGTTIFLTTHDMGEAAELADRVGFLDSGRLLAMGSPNSLVEQYAGETTLRIETESRPAEGTIEGFGDAVERDDSGLSVRSVQPSEIGAIVEQLEQTGIGYGAITWTEPTLEDAYLSLTEQVAEEPPSTTENPISGRN
ncbi:MAG: ABC transporter ATP-binding protein [Halodesulfurarchaeum sp.]|nr:ABC transporter ATP-binding protein [Halodesulfurarchaeum sp.]